MPNEILARQFSTHDKLTQRAPIQMSMSSLLSYMIYIIYTKYVYDDDDPYMVSYALERHGVAS